MKIVFLDVDGVLNHRECIAAAAKRGSCIGALDDKCIDRLKKLSDACFMQTCVIVLTSSWRVSPALVKILDKRLGLFGLKIDSQTTLSGRHRGRQIKEWFEQRPHLLPVGIMPTETQIVIIDDDSDMLPEQMPFFVKTSMETGFTEEHLVKAAEILGIRLPPQ